MRTKKLTYENKKPTSENQTDKKTKTSESKKNILKQKWSLEGSLAISLIFTTNAIISGGACT